MGMQSEVETSHLWYFLHNVSGRNVVGVPNLSIQQFVDTYFLNKLDVVSGVILTIIYGIVFIFGIIGNTSVVALLLRRRFKHVDIDIYHANLAVTDALRLFIGKLRLSNFNLL